MNIVLSLAIPIAAFCFALGITQPLMRIDRLFLFTDQPSLLAIVAGLWNGGDVVLAGLIALFSLAFPAVKLLLLQLAVRGPLAGVPGWLHALSNWSMLDVVLVAIVIFSAKTSGLATAITLPGLWFFAASAIITAIASTLVRRQAPAAHGGGNA